MRLALPTSIVAAGLVLATEAPAHHSYNEVFDFATCITVEGKLTRLDWRNPHIGIYVETTSANGEAGEWRFEGLPTQMVATEEGWSREWFTEGEQITVKGFPVNREGVRYAWVDEVIRADGTNLMHPRRHARCAEARQITAR